MANGIENAGITAPKKIKVRGKEMSVTPNQTAIDPASLGAGAAKLALSFLPGSGEAVAAEDYFKEVEKFKEAKQEGDVGKMAGAGIMTFLAGAGTLPIIGYGPRIIKNIYKGGKDAFNAFRASRSKSTATDLVTGTTDLGPGTELVTLDQKTGTYVEPRTAAPVGDITEAEMLTFSEGTPFYSKGLEVVDNVNYANYNKTGGIEKIRPTIKTKDQSLTAPEWKALFKKNDVTNQELKETGVLEVLDAYEATGERVPVNEIRDLFLVNPAFRIRVKEYGGEEVNDLAKIRATTKRFVEEARITDLSARGDINMRGMPKDEVGEAQYEDILELRDIVSKVQSEVMDPSYGDTGNLGRFLEDEFDKIENLYERMTKNKTFDDFPEVKKTMDRFVKQFGEGGYLNPSIRTLDGPLAAPKFEDSGYTLSGGRDYREKVLISPEIEGQPSKVFSQHYPDKNPLAHIRYDIRTRYDENLNDMNDEVLFIQEMQSDIHQKARDLDYNPNPNLNNEMLAEKVSKMSDVEYKKFMELSSIPPAELTPKDIKELGNLQKRFNELLEKQVSFLGGQKISDKKMPFTPFQDDEYWGDYGIKLMAKQAYTEGKNWLAIAPADMVSGRDGSLKGGVPTYGNAMFYGASDGKSLKGIPKGSTVEKNVKKGVVPKIFERLSQLDPNRPPLEVKKIYIEDAGGELHGVYAMEIDDRFDTVFPMYKNQGGIVSLLRK
jgi:hypothetical protein